MKQLPQSWTVALLTDLLVSLESGSRPRGGVRGIMEGVPSLGGEHLNYDGTFNFSSIKFVPKEFAKGMNKGRVKTNDILIVKDGATTGKTAFVGSDFPFNDAYVNEHVFICRPTPLIDPTFLFRFLMSDEGQNRILRNFQGSAQGGINQSFAHNTEVPLPPIKEERRIVAKLEKLLDKVHTCQTHLGKVTNFSKRFRQSVLDAACSGRLTTNWRNGHSSEDWLEVKLADVIDGKPKNGYSAKPVNYETPFRVLTLTATTYGKFDPQQFKFFDEPIPKDSPLWLQPGDILVQRGNTIEYVGVSAIYEGPPYQFIYPDLMICIRANPRVLPKFLLFALSWERTRNFLRERAMGTAGNMPKINQATLLTAPINLPSLPEQKEIVQRVDSLLSLAEKIDGRYYKANKYIEKLKRSVLAKSFQGELVPQDLSDEPAEKLLERIKTHRVQLVMRTRGKKKGAD